MSSDSDFSFTIDGFKKMAGVAFDKTSSFVIENSLRVGQLFAEKAGELAATKEGLAVGATLLATGGILLGANFPEGTRKIGTFLNAKNFLIDKVRANAVLLSFFALMGTAVFIDKEGHKKVNGQIPAAVLGGAVFLGAGAALGAKYPRETLYLAGKTKELAAGGFGMGVSFIKGAWSLTKACVSIPVSIVQGTVAAGERYANSFGSAVVASAAAGAFLDRAVSSEIDNGTMALFGVGVASATLYALGRASKQDESTGFFGFSPETMLAARKGLLVGLLAFGAAGHRGAVSGLGVGTKAYIAAGTAALIYNMIKGS